MSKHILYHCVHVIAVSVLENEICLFNHLLLQKMKYIIKN